MPANESSLTRSMNLARRFSVQNENDLLQEDMFENTMDSQRTYDHAYCQEIASHLFKYNSLPIQCRRFEDVNVDLKRRDSDTTHHASMMG